LTHCALVSFDRLSDEALALAAQSASPAEISAYDESRRIYARYHRWAVWFYHRAVRYRGLAILRRLPMRGEDLLAAGRLALSPVRAYKVVHLSRLVERIRPAVVLEFGSGGSTAVIAALLERNEQRYGIRGRLISFEQAPDFHARVRDALPVRLRDYVELRLCPVRLERIGHWRAISYDTAYDFGENVDLAYIDGPAPVRGHGELEHPMFSGDLVRLVRAGCHIGAAVTDVRWFNFSFFQDVLGDTHNVRADVFNRSVIVHPKNEFVRIKS
jgi:hypothetical protein